MKKKFRRILAVIVLVVSAMTLEPNVKALIIVPILELLLIDWNDFSYREEIKAHETRN